MKEKTKVYTPRRWVKVLKKQNSPMIVLEAWPPVRCSQQGLHCARQVHESIAHQEKHREERCQEIHIAEKNPALTDENGQEEGSGWFTTGG